MKNLLLLAVGLGAATLAAQSASAQTTQPQPSKKEMKRKEKERKKVGPEVYKGSVAEQQRVITDAPGAEKDKDSDGEEASTKKVKRKN